METGIIIAACIVAYFLQLGMGAVLGTNQNKWLKIGFIIPGIGLLVQLVYLFYCMFYIMFDEWVRHKVTYSNLFKLLHLGKYERHLLLIGVWRNWLAHLPDTEGVSGSIPDTPTNTALSFNWLRRRPLEAKFQDRTLVGQLMFLIWVNIFEIKKS